ncbi:COP1-interactive protein 1-like isoform X1 [Homalodisca vitripennis]|uniref:COP1-interactive protein 1-like isoform X1 n=1 Tax=Homalodisca vitripennis TaxID=197043 RepID=UPI001EEAC577|nr:COP1-interactive protein 1-like isoform X1 [Homalodisca vitripennis]
MEEMRSPQSESLRNEGYENLSIGSLIQNSVATLEHECATLEQDIEEKSQGLQELKNMCAKQEENISKQRLELEHIKIKTYTEVMNREAFLAKYSSLRDKSEPLKVNMEKWFEWLNHIMLAKEDIQQFFGCVQQKTDSEASGCQQLEDVYNYAHQQTLKVFGDLDGNRKKMKQEFDAMNNELRSQLSLRTQRERELEEQLREIKKECDEKTKVIEVVSSQVAELDKTFDHLNNKLAEDLKNTESTTNQLQTSLQEELIRKENLSTKLKVTDELICKAKIEMRDEESEMKSLDSNHKQLIVEGENYCSKLKDDLEELNSLQANYDSMRAQFCTLSGVDEDNGSLKLKIDELIEIHDSYKNKLADISVVEKCRSDELNNINNLIENKEIEKSQSNSRMSRHGRGNNKIKSRI